MTLVTTWASGDPRADQLAQMDERLVMQPEALMQKAYIHGKSKSDEFYIHETEEGFPELQYLFMGALSQAESIGPCCVREPRQTVTLNVRSPYYVHLGEQPVLIETLDLAWPRSNRDGLYMVLNERFVIEPKIKNRSLDLLAEWADRRGFN